MTCPGDRWLQKYEPFLDFHPVTGATIEMFLRIGRSKASARMAPAGIGLCAGAASRRQSRAQRRAGAASRRQSRAQRLPSSYSAHLQAAARTHKALLEPQWNLLDIGKLVNPAR
jgi:hypothetical protein